LFYRSITFKILVTLKGDGGKFYTSPQTPEGASVVEILEISNMAIKAPLLKY
jgi:hypothetical protein